MKRPSLIQAFSFRRAVKLWSTLRSCSSLSLPRFLFFRLSHSTSYLLVQLESQLKFLYTRCSQCRAKFFLLRISSSPCPYGSQNDHVPVVHDPPFDNHRRGRTRGWVWQEIWRRFHCGNTQINSLEDATLDFLRTLCEERIYENLTWMSWHGLIIS